MSEEKAPSGIGEGVENASFASAWLVHERPMTGTSLRLGVIGTGKIAARHLAILAEADANVAVVAHLGRSSEKANAAAAHFGGNGFTEIHRFLAEGRPDAVFVTVPPDGHGTIELELAAARIPFLVEKPIGLDLAAITAIAEAVYARGIPAAVGFNWRASDLVPSVRDLVRHHPPRLVIGRYHSGTPPTPWWRSQARSGGQFVEQGCHVLDLARSLLGEAEFLAAAGNHAALPDYPDADISGAGAALVRFEGGVPGTFTATCLLPKTGGADLTLIGDRCQITISQKELILQVDGRTEITRAAGGEYARQDRAFFDAVRSGDDSSLYCSYADAVGTHELCLRIRDAIASK